MTVVSNATRELLRSDQRTVLHLFVFQPQPIFKAQINAPSIGRNAFVIPYNNVTYGSYTDIKPGMTLWVGSTPGGNDLGKVRVRSATSTQLVVAENSHIPWQNGAYLTVVNFFELWSVYPRFVQDSSDKTKVIWYKDRDIAYTDQNRENKLGVFFRCGPHRASNSLPASFYFDASETSLVGSSTISSITWSFPGGSPSSFNGTTPGWVTYNNPGFYNVEISVTTSGGVTEKSYRHVIVTNGDQFPQWALERLSGSYKDGGWQADITVYNYSQTSQVIDNGYLVIITAEDDYGGVVTSVGGNYTHEGRILFVGYVQDGSINYDVGMDTLRFSALSPMAYTNNLLMFPVEIHNSGNASPNVWWKLQGMTIKRAIYHYLRWHTTLLLTTDFIYKDPQDLLLPIFSVNRGTVFQELYNFLESARGCAICSDRQGTVYVDKIPSYVKNAYTLYSPEITLEDRDFAPPTVEFGTSQLSYIQVGGIQQGTDPEHIQPLLACAPGDTPAYRGASYNDRQGFVVASQSELTDIAGAIYWHSSYPIRKITLQLVGKYTNFDLVPFASAAINTRLGTFRAFPETIEFTHEDFVLRTSVSFIPLVDAYSGQIIPVSPPGDQPPPPPPPTPQPPIDPPPPNPPPPVDISIHSLVLQRSSQIWATDEFHKENPHWYRVDLFPPEDSDVFPVDFTCVHGGGIYVTARNSGPVEKRRVYYAPVRGMTLQKIFDENDIISKLGGNPIIGAICDYPVSFYPGPSAMFIAISSYSGNRVFAHFVAEGTEVRGPYKPIWPVTVNDMSSMVRSSGYFAYSAAENNYTRRTVRFIPFDVESGGLYDTYDDWVIPSYGIVGGWISNTDLCAYRLPDASGKGRIAIRPIVNVPAEELIFEMNAGGASGPYPFSISGVGGGTLWFAFYDGITFRLGYALPPYTSHQIINVPSPTPEGLLDNGLYLVYMGGDGRVFLSEDRGNSWIDKTGDLLEQTTFYGHGKQGDGTWSTGMTYSPVKFDIPRFLYGG